MMHSEIQQNNEKVQEELANARTLVYQYKQATLFAEKGTPLTFIELSIHLSPPEKQELLQTVKGSEQQLFELEAKIRRMNIESMLEFMYIDYVMQMI